MTTDHETKRRQRARQRAAAATKAPLPQTPTEPDRLGRSHRPRQKHPRPLPPAGPGMTTTTYARNRLHDAISALCDPTWHQRHPIPSRYAQLRDGIANPAISGHHHTPPASMIPAQIDCLKLTIHIDNRVTILTRGTPNRPSSVIDRLQQLTTHKWRPQDIEHIETLTAEISSWVKKIDDLFGPKPVYLKQPCPHCGHNTAHKLNDEGDTIRTPALAITIEHNERPAMARCQHCHDAWTGPQPLKLLARMLT